MYIIFYNMYHPAFEGIKAYFKIFRASLGYESLISVLNKV